MVDTVLALTCGGGIDGRFIPEFRGIRGAPDKDPAREIVLPGGAVSCEKLFGFFIGALQDVEGRIWDMGRFFSPDGPSHRLYSGATYDQPFNGMYSFVPCRPATNPVEGFPRPIIDLEDFSGIITPTLKQGAKLNRTLPGSREEMSLEHSTTLWNRVKEEVEKSCRIGISIDLPPGLENVTGFSPKKIRDRSSADDGCAPKKSGGTC